MTTCKNCIHCELCFDDNMTQFDNGNAEQCTYFKDASKLVELPCKVGDIIYTLVSGEIKESKIISINYISTTKITSFTFLVENYRGLPLTYTEESIGEITFLTREEAEKALRLREHEQE